METGQSETTMREHIDTSNEAIAIACMLVSNPQGAIRRDGWQKQVNDLIRALRDQRDAGIGAMFNNGRLKEENERLRAVFNAAKDFADYHTDYETADLQGIANGTLKDDCHTDKTASIILAVRTHVGE